ncbi:MAG TPA: hypothetical protein VKG24_28240 [Pseudolabrys sp.]|jgi:hypothetical protein|nr:hypothetical protein [Pseudolabrys sp.]
MPDFDSPFVVFAAVLVVQWLAAYAGDTIRKRMRPFKKEGERQDFDIVRAASLTLLGLIIGFSFAMAVSRYDQRKNLEEAEANAIGTAYLRADLLPADDASRVRELLRSYCNERISYYLASSELRLGQIDADTAKLQTELWGVVVRVAKVQPTPIVGLVVSGMNDVMNAQGYTQAAWWNRIPFTAWVLMALIAIACNLLLGYGEHSTTAFLLILPLIVSISLFLIADIDSPRAGIIRVQPHNLVSQCQAMKPVN